MLCGFVLGILTGWALLEIGFGVFVGPAGPFLPPVLGALGGLLFRMRRRYLLWGTSAVTVVVFLVISYTPLIEVLARPALVNTDIQRAPAVVALASDIHRNGDLPAAAQSRLLRAYELLQRGYASELIVTRLPHFSRSYVPTIMGQMRDLGFEYPISEVGQVSNTHDEAVLVAALAKQRGWDRVLLVTQPWHMQRAVAVFEKAGLHVIPAPCVESNYEMNYLKQPGDRRQAFRDWLHEVVGYQIYKMRGWI